MTKLFLFLILITLIACNSNDHNIVSNQNIDICFETGPDMFPSHWYTEVIDPKTTPLPNEDKERLLKIINEAIKKYPEQMIRKELNEVYVLGSLSFYGVEFAGTYNACTLYISSGEISEGYTDFFLEQTFHHEFSSILFNNYDSLFDGSAWMELNPEDFRYRDNLGGAEAIKNGNDSQIFDTVLQKQGFLYEYSLSTLENDFNSIAENLFSPSTKFWDAFRNYPIIERKALLAIEFFNKIDSEFSIYYFQEFEKG